MIGLIIFIALMGLLVWAVTTFIPMPASFKTAIFVVAVVILILVVLNAFGLLSGVRDVDVPRID